MSEEAVSFGGKFGNIVGTIKDAEAMCKLDEQIAKSKAEERKSEPQPMPTAGNNSLSVPDYLYVNLGNIMKHALKEDPELEDPVMLEASRAALALFQLTEERSNFGKEKYGTVLRTNNGRDSLEDCRQEIGDLLLYATQAALEGKQGLRDLTGLLTDVAQWINHLCNAYSLYGKELKPVLLQLNPEPEVEEDYMVVEYDEYDYDEDDDEAYLESSEHWDIEQPEDDEGDES
jgi:hypothetical protein